MNHFQSHDAPNSQQVWQIQNYSSDYTDVHSFFRIVFFSISVFFHEHSRFTGQQGKRETKSSLPLPSASQTLRH